MKFSLKRLSIPAFSALALLTLVGGCGGGSSDGNNSAVQIGQFIDSPVEGIRYQTASQAGSTNSDGEFQYREGESITFQIGDITFQAVTAAPVITPLDLGNTNNIDNTTVTNIARLLQSLDQDCNPDNGIVITPEAHLAAASLSVDFSSLLFNNQVTNLVANAGQTSSNCQTIVGAQSARNHFQASLNSLDINTTTGAAQPVVNNANLGELLGTWEGTARVPSGYAWTVHIELSENRLRIEYPTLATSGCYGELELREQTEGRALFHRTITEDTGGCLSGGFVALVGPIDGEVQYQFYWEDDAGVPTILAATGPLYKID